MHLVTLAVPSTMSNAVTQPRSTRLYAIQKMLHCQIQALRLNSYTGNLLTYIGMGLVANRQEVTFIAGHYLRPHLTLLYIAGVSHRPLHAWVLCWTSDWLRTGDELAATSHFCHHSYRISSDFNLYGTVKKTHQFICTGLLRSTGNAYDVISYRRLSRPRAPPIFWTSLYACGQANSAFDTCLSYSVHTP